MLRLLWSGFFIVLLLSGCGLDGSPTRNNDFTPLTSISIVAVSTIAAQTSTKLSVIGNYAGLFTRDITGQVVWSSDAPNVANTFTAAANPDRAWVTAGTSPGTANLTATVGKVSATFPLTVTSATISKITITPANPTLAKGLTTRFTASGDFSDNTTQDMTFDATWSSSNQTAATISNTVGEHGFTQTLEPGVSTITATFNGVSGTTFLTVTTPVLQSIAVSPGNPSILTLFTQKFTATGTYSDGTTPDITTLANWTSSTSAVAKIGANTGVATTVAPGTATISATLGGVSGTSTLKVTGGTLQSIAIKPVTLAGSAQASTNLALAQGTSARIAAIGTFSNGSTRDISGLVKWSTSNAKLATVSLPVGNLVWLNAVAATPASASTTVSVTSGDLTVTADLTVTNPTLSGITILTPASLNLTAGTSSRFTLDAAFSDGTTQDVTASSTWTSNSSSIATAGDLGIAKGQVTGVAAGTATISAKYGSLNTSSPIVTITTRTLQNLAISGTLTVASGNQVTFTATATYADGFTSDVSEKTAWSIDKLNVAILANSVSQPGQVVAVDRGSATLTASFGGKNATATITVP